MNQLHIHHKMDTLVSFYSWCKPLGAISVWLLPFGNWKNLQVPSSQDFLVRNLWTPCNFSWTTASLVSRFNWFLHTSCILAQIIWKYIKSIHQVREHAGNFVKKILVLSWGDSSKVHMIKNGWKFTSKYIWPGGRSDGFNLYSSSLQTDLLVTTENWHYSKQQRALRVKTC